jgi:hypothetical protein
MPTTYKLQLDPPVFIDISSVDGTATARVDAMEARRVMEEAEKLKDEAAMASHINGWLAGKLKCDQSLLAENVAFAFYAQAVAIATRLAEDRKKKALATVSSPASTAPDSPTTCC